MLLFYCSAYWRIKENILTGYLNNPQAALHLVAFDNLPVCLARRIMITLNLQYLATRDEEFNAFLVRLHGRAMPAKSLLLVGLIR